MVSQSPLDDYVPELREYYRLGYGPTLIAQLFLEEHQLETTRSSVSRALERHRIVELVSEDEGDYENEEGVSFEVETKYRIPRSDPVGWGAGRAKLVAPSTTRDTEIVLFVSDIHVPYHDVELLEDFFSFASYMQPDRLVINGDMADFFYLSRFDKSRQHGNQLVGDLETSNWIRRRIREAVPNAVIDETEGNHDNRIRTYIEENANAFKDVPGLNPGILFEHDALGINWHSDSGFLLRPEFIVRHGTVARKGGGNSAKAELDSTGISGISGHTHRLATHRKSGYTQRQWTEQGCICRMDPDYIKGGLPDWQQGCVIGEFSTKSNTFITHEIPVFESKFVTTLFTRGVNVPVQRKLAIV